MTWLKICGITRAEDAECCHAAGADAIGFIFAPSVRQVTLAQADRICRAVPAIVKVGVFVDAPLQQVQQQRRQLGLDIIQLHGRESNDYCRQLGGVVIKAIRPQSAFDLHDIDRYIDVWKILVDAYTPGRMGGTGLEVTAAVLQGVMDFSRIILAGGIGPNNAKTVMDAFRPYGLDSSSRLEANPGVKDHEQIKSLCKLVKGPAYEE